VGNGDGTFDPPVAASPALGLDDAAFPLELADVTGDGALDVVARFGDKVSVLPGNGDGTFDGPINSGFSDAGHAETLIADFTGDGHRDLGVAIVTGGEDVSSSDIYLQTGDGTGRFEVVQKLTVDTNIAQGTIADLNGDTLPDMAMIGNGGSNGGRAGLWVLLNEGGAFAPGAYYPRGQWGLGAGDLNVDGSVDLVSSDLLISLNDGNGVFDQTLNLPGENLAAAVGDFTQDGRPDMISVVGLTPFDLLMYRNVTPIGGP
jgi:FG-GAP-like repeat